MNQNLQPARFALAIALLTPAAFAQEAATQRRPLPTVTIEKEVSKRDARRAEQAYLNGARMVDRGDLERAESEFARAQSLNPKKPEYPAALLHTRDQRVALLVEQATKARLMNDPKAADILLAKARVLSPLSPLLAAESDIAANLQIIRRDIPGDQPIQREFAAPIQLLPTSQSQDIHLHADSQQVVQQVATLYGIKVVFDESVPHADLHFALDAAPYDQAMRILLHMTHLFAVPLDTHTLLVAKDTQETRQKFERLVEESIYVPGSTTEQVNELVNIVKNVFDVKQVSSIPGSGTILIRAPEATLKVVNYTLADLIDGNAQVMLELKLYTVDKTRTRVTGAGLPTGFGAFSVAAEAQSLVSANQSIITAAISSGALTLTGSASQNLLIEAIFLIASGVASSSQISGLLGIIGGGLTSLGVYEVGNASFNLSLNSSDVRALDNMQVRVGSGQDSTFRIGSKYPITTSTYATGASSGVSSNATINGVSVQSLINQYLGTSGSTTSTTPQIQYEDLGITLKTTPVVLKSGLVSMKVDLKIEALTGASLDNIPVLTSRAFVSSVTVMDGTSAVILSELSKQESGAISGIPGLSDLPGFQDATQRTTESDSSELVLTLTPHIVRRRTSEIASPRIPFQTSTPADY